MKKLLFTLIMILTSTQASAFLGYHYDSYRGESAYLKIGTTNNDYSLTGIESASGFDLSAGVEIDVFGLDIGYANLGNGNGNEEDYFSAWYTTLDIITTPTGYENLKVRFKLGFDLYDADGASSTNGLGVVYGVGMTYKIADSFFGNPNSSVLLGLEYTHFGFGAFDINQYALTTRIRFHTRR